MPTEFTLKISFEAIFINAKKIIHFDERDNVDLCCRSFHKCEAYKHHEFNYRNETNMQNCNCIKLFQNCLENLNTSLSSEVSFFHSMNNTKCYDKDYPIIKCKTVEIHLESKAFPFLNSAEHEQFFNRCSTYYLDQGHPKQLQIFDVPLNKYAISALKGGSLSKTVVIFKIFMPINFAVVSKILDMFWFFFIKSNNMFCRL